MRELRLLELGEIEVSIRDTQFLGIGGVLQEVY